MTVVVVLGASGFIGRAVCAELVRRGVAVQGYGRSDPPTIQGLDYRRVPGYNLLPRFHGEICVHLAGENRYRGSASDFESASETGVALARRIADRGFAGVVFGSSAMIYGDEVERPRQEWEQPKPKGAYALMKHAVEQIFLSDSNVVARIPNVYGSGMPADNVLSDILRQIPGDGPIRVRDGRPARDFIHVSDVAAGLVEIALNRPSGIFNLGTGVGTSVEELAGCLAKLAGEGGRKVLSGTNSDCCSTLVLDPQKMYDQFGWRARVPLSEGLKRLIQDRGL